MTWNDSVDYCRGLGMELASVHSEEEWSKVKESAATAVCDGNCGGHPSSCDWFWLGGSLVGSQGTWTDGTPFDWQPDFFEINEGGNTYISGWRSASCYGKGDGWHDAENSWKMQAICKGTHKYYHLI